ncbi:unnamed protein product [Ranitomeya imitator]|uniref:ribonuclease H n=1 Tax=Ranitomeya imitator TaxID=111125 RepID=A0ABN9L4V7_9NEOB|nr:unnamed protein product [Ranitomeya imitator]
MKLLTVAKHSTPKPKVTGSHIPFVNTYHPYSRQVQTSLRKHLGILCKSTPNVPEFQQPFLSYYRRPANIKDKLVRADVGPSTREPRQVFLRIQKRGTFPCLSCLQCNNIQKGDKIFHPHTGRGILIKVFYVIYMIKWPCGFAYIGETTQAVRDRISQHKSNIRCYRDHLPLPHHFRIMGHNIAQLRSQVLEQIEQNRRGQNRTKLLKKALGLLYDEPNSVDQAEKSLLALSQGQEAAELYCQKFRKWSVLTKWNNDALAAIFRKGLSESVKDVMDVFDEPKSSFLPPHRDCDCAIDLIPGCKFPKGRLFNLSVPEHTAMRSFIKESLEKGHIRPSSSPLGAGFFFVAKKDGSLRPCIDYRLLNKITVKFQYPLPLLSDLFARIKGASWFTKIDLRGAYNLVRIKQGDEWKTAFNTPEGHFGVQKVSFLGFIFSPSSIEMDLVKVQAIHDWIQPTSVKSLQKFLGFANFYRRFIANFSSVVKPLTDLTKKSADVANWSPVAVSAFQELKHRLTSAPVLRQPDVSLPFQVEVDASEIGAGAVLSQRDPVGSLMKPCAFFFRTFSPAERNYDVGNRELLATKWAFEEWRHWLEGAKHRIVVLTNHKNLIYLESAIRLNPRQA